MVKGTFALIVDIHFKQEEHVASFLEWIRPEAEHVRQHEPATLSYEVAVADDNPLRVVVIERYVDKQDAYLSVHKSSEPFLAFRAKLQKLQAEELVVIDGQSYLETGSGFVRPSDRDPSAQESRQGRSGTWDLFIVLEFTSEEDMNQILEALQPVQQHVRDSESQTLSYEVAIADNKPLKLILFDRFVDKEAYVSVHKLSEPLQKFRPLLQEMQDSGRVSMVGQSYLETGIGFV